MDIKNVKVTTSKQYISDDEARPTGRYEYRLNLDIPLPGGKASYEFQLTEKQYKSLEMASKLSEAIE